MISGPQSCAGHAYRLGAEILKREFERGNIGKA
jgi:hypothetical protein